MAIPPAVTPIIQIPMLVGYLKLASSIKKLFGKDEVVRSLSEIDV